MSNTQHSSRSFESDDAVQALNEHGFLFQLLIRERVKKIFAEYQNRQHNNFERGWSLAGEEYPVMAVDETPTRIDLVLRHQESRGVQICLECKRANPDYKAWLFFDQTLKDGVSELFIEQILHHEASKMGLPQIVRTNCSPADCRVFRYYLEGAVKKGNRAASATETVEKAFRQLMASSSGLIQKLRKHGKEQDMPWRSILALVTTAELYHAAFSLESISPNKGTIESKDLKLEPMLYCGVNYHADDSLNLDVQSPIREVVSNLILQQTRTVFVVHVSALGSFLSLAQKFV